MKVTYEEAKRALVKIKSHELARYMTALNCGVDWSGSTKGSMIEAIADDYLGHYQRIVDRYGRLARWAASITAAAERDRNMKAALKSQQVKVKSEKANALQAAIATGEKLRRGEAVDACDRAKFFNAALSALNHKLCFI